MEKHYGIWILPPEKEMVEYQGIIDSYSKKLGTDTFEPHITLLGRQAISETEITKNVEAVVRNIKPIEITISEISISTAKHQCVFARIKSTPDLLDAHMQLKFAFNKQNEGPYMPHMSLIYADLPSKEKFELAEEIEQKIKTFTFTSSIISVVSAENSDPKTWEHVADFKLGI